jgi:hypothetical protein
VMRHAGNHRDGLRMRELIVVLWRADCESAKRSRSPRAIPTRPAGHFSSGAGREQRAGGWDGPLGLGATRPLAPSPRVTAGRGLVLRDQRTNPRASMLSRLGPCTAPHDRTTGQRETKVRAAPICRPLGYADQAWRDPQIPGLAVGKIGIQAAAAQRSPEPTLDEDGRAVTVARPSRAPSQAPSRRARSPCTGAVL